MHGQSRETSHCEPVTGGARERQFNSLQVFTDVVHVFGLAVCVTISSVMTLARLWLMQSYRQKEAPHAFSPVPRTDSETGNCAGPSTNDAVLRSCYSQEHQDRNTTSYERFGRALFSKLANNAWSTPEESSSSRNSSFAQQFLQKATLTVQCSSRL